jgi:hypothetical protein
MADPLPTPLPPPPRGVRAVRRSAFVSGSARLLLVPFVLIGLAMPLAIAVRMGVQLMGRPITATVDGLDRVGNPRDGRPSCFARLHYTLDDRLWEDRQPVTADELARLHVGDRVTGRAATFLGHALALTSAGNVNRTTGVLALVTVALDAAIALLVYGNWLVPARTRRLLETGTAVAGEVMAAMPFHARGGYRVRVAYRFPTPAGDEGGDVTVNGPPGAATAVGRPVTVVYDPARPTRSTVYEFSGYTVSP